MPIDLIRPDEILHHNLDGDVRNHSDTDDECYLYECFKNEKKRIVMKAEPKSGKTRAFINFIEKLKGHRFIYLTPRVFLCMDQYEEFTKHGITCDFIRT